MRTPDARSSRRAWLAWGGILLSGFAVTSYFLIIPRISVALRDSGNANIALGGVGVIVSLAGVAAAWRAARGLKLAVFGLLASVGFTGLLAYYVHGLSYQVPAPEQVIAVGTAAPDFRLRDQEGVERSLVDFASKRLILVFFRGHW